MIYEGEGIREEKEMGEGKRESGKKRGKWEGEEKNKGGEGKILEGNIRGMMVIEIYEGGGKGRGSTLPIM